MKQCVALLFFFMFSLGQSVWAESDINLASTPKLSQLADQLNFTERQRTQLTELLNGYAEKARGLQTRALKLRTEMQMVQMSDLNEDVVRRLSNESGKLSAAHTHALLSTQREFYRLLSARQKTEYAKLREQAKDKASASGGTK